MRSGYVAGDARILEKFLLYRTYHGSAMSLAIQAASRAAWEDETHVRDNRRLYREKFEAFTGILHGVAPVRMPEAAFYIWLPTPVPDTEFACRLYEACSVTVLPGSVLAREARGVNPGQGFVRIALVSSPEECTQAALRIRAFMTGKQP
jgi:N-succinyldiaminopimelate aminotransferase